MGVRPLRSGPFMNIDHWPLGRAVRSKERAWAFGAGTSATPLTATMTTRAERNVRLGSLGCAMTQPIYSGSTGPGDPGKQPCTQMTSRAECEEARTAPGVHSVAETD